MISRRLLLSLRVSIAMGLVLAVVLPWEKLAPTGRYWIAICDISESIAIVHREQKSQLLRFYENKLRALAQKLNPQDRLAVLFFGNGAEIARPFAPPKAALTLPSPSISGQSSELSPAIRLALRLLQSMPQGIGNGNLLIFTDGNISDAQAEESRAVLSDSGISFHLASALPDKPFGDVGLHSLVIPLSLSYSQDSLVTGYVIGHSNQAGTVRLQLWAQDILCQDQTIALTKPGQFKSFVTFRLPVPQGPKMEVKATIASLSFEDLFTDNNDCRCVIQVMPKAEILVIGSTLPGLEKQFQVRTVQPADLAQSMSQLEAFQALVISQGQAEHLGDLEKLNRYVFHGGGLLVLGNETTLGPGHYANSALEKALPVLCSGDDNQKLALLVIVDVSGSMGEILKTGSKLNQARLSLPQALTGLRTEDWIAIMAFRDQPRLLLPFAPFRGRSQEIGALLEQSTAAGGTSLVPALTLAMQTFAAVTASRKHILLISDGLAAEKREQVLGWGPRLQEAGITVTAVATGSDAGGILQDIAHNTGGQFYQAQDSSMANILQKEIADMQPPLIGEGPFLVRAFPNDLLQTRLPLADGRSISQLVSVRPKEWGEVLLQTPTEKPVLVCGHYGLGRSAVLTTHMAWQWGGAFMKTHGDTLLREIVAWLTKPHTSPLPLSFVLHDDAAEICIELDPAIERAIHNRVFQLHCSWNGQKIPLVETGVGLYGAFFPLPPVGDHRLAVEEKDERGWQIVKIGELILPYLAEYRKLGFSPLDLGKPPATAASSGQHVWEQIPHVTILLGVVLVLVVVERYCSVKARITAG